MPARMMRRHSRPRARSAIAEAEDVQHQRGLGCRLYSPKAKSHLKWRPSALCDEQEPRDPPIATNGTHS